MVGSIAFEGYNHFMVMSPDHVSQVPPGAWGGTFRITAVLSLVTEIIALVAAVFILLGIAKKPLAAPTTDAPSHS